MHRRTEHAAKRINRRIGGLEITPCLRALRTTINRRIGGLEKKQRQKRAL